MKNAQPTPGFVQGVYLTLTLLSTLASSLIWGINTLFLLNAGLSNAQAFLANAFFTAGEVLFEIPTGIVADMRGRRLSYLLGTVTLAASTLAYLAAWMWRAPFWAWVVSSILLGLGFTFFSGATEAWLVDAMHASGYQGEMESVFSKGQAVSGAAMLVGSVAGGAIAQATDLGVPYIVRAAILLFTFGVAFFFMKDWGFTPDKSSGLVRDVKQLFTTSFDVGLRKPAIRWVMLGAPFAGGVGIYVFYAMQPHLLNLYGDPSAYGIAGLAAAAIACAQIAGALLAPQFRKLFKLRTTTLLVGELLSLILLAAMGLLANFWAAIALLVAWGLIFSAVMPIRQTYLNTLIPSKQRATVLSFDSLMSSSGGMFIQPALGRAADVWNYPTSFLFSAAIYAAALPFAALARREQVKATKEPHAAQA